VTGAVPSQYDMLMTTDQVRMEPGGVTATDVTCCCDTETFVLLMYGRLTPQAAVVNGRLVVEGDRRLLTVGKWFTGV
jgi:putative sterol carrier protein